MSRFIDPTFEYHAAMVKFYGSMLLRLSEDRIVPLNFTEYSSHLEKHITKLSAFTLIPYGFPS